MTLTLTPTLIISVISIALTLVSIVINACILRALLKTSQKSLSSFIKKGAETASTVFEKLNLNGVADVVGLVKDLVIKDPSHNETGAEDPKE